MKQRILTFCLSLMMLLSLAAGVGAQDFTEQQVIDMAIAQAPFSYGLQTVSDWSAAAYDTHNAYGIWRVQFWDGDGEEIGWANIDPAQERMYDYEGPFESTEEQKVAADPIVREFIQTHPDVIALLGDPEIYDDNTWISYNGWVEAWGAWIGREEDSLYLMVQFAGKTPDSLTDPELIEIGFPEVQSYSDWSSGMNDQATAVAFAQPDIAGALRDITGWTSEVERQADGLWHVSFMQEDTEVAMAVVNLETREIVDWNAP